MKAKKKIAKELIQNTKKCFTLVMQYQKSHVFITSFLVVVQSILPALIITVMKTIINLLQRGKGQWGTIVEYILIYVLLNLLATNLNLYYLNYSKRFNLEFSKHINILMLKKATELQLNDYENSETYDVISRAQNQGGAYITDYISTQFSVMMQLIKVVTLVAILLEVGIFISGLILIPSIIKCIGTIKFNKDWYNLRQERTAEEREIWYTNYLITTGNAFKEIKFFGLGNYLVSKCSKMYNKIIEQDRKMLNIILLLTLAINFIESLCGRIVVTVT